MIERWGAFVARRALAVLLAGLALAVFAGAYGMGVFDSLSQGGFDDPAAESSRELRAEQATFGNKSVDVVAIYSDDTLTADSAAFQDRVRQVVASLPTGTTSSEDEASGIDVDAIGVILIVVGIIGFILSLIFWDRWGAGMPWGGTRRVRVVEGAPVQRTVAAPAQTTVVEEEVDQPAGPPPGEPPPP